MPLIKSPSKKAMSTNIEREMHAGKPQKQSIAIAYSVARQARKKKMAKGGMISADKIVSEIPEHHEIEADREHPYHSDALGRETYFSKGGMTDVKDMLDEDHMDLVEELRRRRRMMAKGGQVDLQDNENEHLNEADDLNYDAARKDTYFDLDDQVNEQPEDSNMHGHKIEDENEHSEDMIEAIRKKRKIR